MNVAFLFLLIGTDSEVNFGFPSEFMNEKSDVRKV